MKKTALIILTMLFAMNSQGQDRHFAWTYESTVLPKGNVDFEPWFTYSTGRDQFYHRLNSRLEFEVGLTNRIQTAFYINSMFESGTVVDSLGMETSIASNQSYSFSNEWKINILNPSVRGIGLALYGEYLLSGKETELEYKIIIDKKMLNNTIAFNHVGEFEFEHEVKAATSGSTEIETEREYSMENDLAFMHLFSTNMGAGLEFRSKTKIENKDTFSSLFIGPTFFYSGNRPNGNGWFIIFNIQSRVYDAEDHIYSASKQFQGDFEKVQSRLILGFSF